MPTAQRDIQKDSESAEQAVLECAGRNRISTVRGRIQEADAVRGGKIEMHIFHKWKTIAESDKWKAKQCQKCGKIEWVNKWGAYGGHQPRPLLPGEKEPEPPTGGSHIFKD